MASPSLLLHDLRASPSPQDISFYTTKPQPSPKQSPPASWQKPKAGEQSSNLPPPPFATLDDQLQKSTSPDGSGYASERLLSSFSVNALQTSQPSSSPHGLLWTTDVAGSLLPASPASTGGFATGRGQSPPSGGFSRGLESPFPPSWGTPAERRGGGLSLGPGGDVLRGDFGLFASGSRGKSGTKAGASPEGKGIGSASRGAGEHGHVPGLSQAQYGRAGATVRESDGSLLEFGKRSNGLNLGGGWDKPEAAGTRNVTNEMDGSLGEGSAAGRDGSEQATAGEGEGEGQGSKEDQQKKWVTVFGFSPQESSAVLHEFERFGPILETVAGPTRGNWMHIHFETQEAAFRALSTPGFRLLPTTFVGVKPVSPGHWSEIMQRGSPVRSLDATSASTSAIRSPDSPQFGLGLPEARAESQDALSNGPVAGDIGPLFATRRPFGVSSDLSPSLAAARRHAVKVPSVAGRRGEGGPLAAAPLAWEKKSLLGKMVDVVYGL